jgi:hypothetical protein
MKESNNWMSERVQETIEAIKHPEVFEKLEHYLDKRVKKGDPDAAILALLLYGRKRGYILPDREDIERGAG